MAKGIGGVARGDTLEAMAAHRSGSWAMHPLWAAVAGGLAWALTIGVGGAASANDVNLAPSKTLAGAGTGLGSPFDVAFDDSGAMYVANESPGSVTAYASGWATGNTAPTKTLTGPATELAQPRGIAFDSGGAMYVVNQSTETVTAYSAGWGTGNTAPVKVLSGLSTGISVPVGIAFDDSDRMYVANSGGNTVTVYAAGWVTGDSAPVKTLAGGSTGLNAPWAIAFDSGGAMYVTNAGLDGSVTAYAAGWATGNTAPTKTLAGSSTGLGMSAGVAFGAGDAMYVTNVLDNTVAVYAAGWATGNTAPARTITGAATGLNSPAGIEFDATGNPYVANLGGTVAAYAPVGVGQSITFAQPADTVVNAGPVMASASASSGLAVSLASATTAVCTVAGDEIALVAVGTCTVNANQAGNGTYLPASPVSRSFAVTAAPAPANSSQYPASSCVTAPGRLRARVATRLMRPGCATNAGQRVGVSVTAVPRTRAASFALSCKVGRTSRKTVAIAYGSGYRTCASGDLLLRVTRKKLALGVTWRAPPLTGYDEYTLVRTYRT